MQALGRLVEIESVLYSEEDIFRWDESRRISFQFQVISSAFRYHYEQCEIYRRFCQAEGVRPETIFSPDDILRIPLIPSSMFKSLEVRTVPEDQIILRAGQNESISREERLCGVRRPFYFFKAFFLL
ncbi:MAG: hypothetical protein L0229_18585, partial [Blastocatellia bacterium]|nr:hypothetical protein [Blastocatellia bacterium]